MKKLIRQLNTMSPQTAGLLTLGLAICDALLAGAVLLLLRAGPFCLDTYFVYITASYLERTELAVLFASVVMTAFYEEQIRKG